MTNVANFMKKVFLFSGVLYFLTSFYLLAVNYETSSQYWSLTSSGPKTMNEAIDKYFNDRPLDKMEGIWTEDNWGLLAVIKEDEYYREYALSVGFEHLRGRNTRTYIKTPSPDVYTLYTMIIFQTYNPGEYLYTTSPGKIIFDNENYSSYYIDDHALNKTGARIRNWPLDLEAHNKKFENTIEPEYL